MKFTNEEGVTWEKNEFCNDYKEHQIWLCTMPDGVQSYVITRDDQIVGDSQSIEAIYCKINVLRMLQD